MHLRVIAVLGICACTRSADCPAPTQTAVRYDGGTTAPDPSPSRDAAAGTASVSKDTLEFVRLGYGDVHDKPFRSLNFRTECLSTDLAKQAVVLVPEYNAFEGSKVAAALEQLRGEYACFEFGRESSPVLYVHLPYWTQQQEKSCPERHDPSRGSCPEVPDARRLTPAELRSLQARAREVFTAAGADEIGFEHPDSKMRLRVWWD